MFRVLLRETFFTALCLAMVSAAAFALLDLTGRRDWFGTATHAHATGLTVEHITAQDLPLFWNRHVDDAVNRTARDLDALSRLPDREAARARLLHRGTAALPTVLAQLPHLAEPARHVALMILARWAPALTGGDHAPVDDSTGLTFWQGFGDMGTLDFRPGNAQRQAERIVGHLTHNAQEQITRLGTYALPALFQVLASVSDREARVRLTGALSDITGIPLRIADNAPPAEVTRVVDAWRAFWFAEHLEYQPLSPWQRALGHVNETRYGRWVARALRGRLGDSVTTTRPVDTELRERLPGSALVSGLGGLLATAAIVAFGGGPVLRRRPLRPKLLDLAGALVPGLAAFVAAWIALVGACAAGATLPLVRATLVPWLRLSVATVLLALVASQWLRRPALRVTLHAVRVEAETWASEGFSPGVRAVVRHGARIGVASLLAPLGLAAPPVLLASLVVEPMLGIHGMGSLTLAGVRHMDAPWLLVAVLTTVPVLLGRRWARRSLVWLVTPDAQGTDAPPVPDASAPAEVPGSGLGAGGG